MALIKLIRETPDEKGKTECYVGDSSLAEYSDKGWKRADRKPMPEKSKSEETFIRKNKKL